MRSIVTIVFFVMISTHKQILTKAHYYWNIFTVYLKTCGCGYFREPHPRMLVTSLACRVVTVVTKSWGPGIFPGYCESEPRLEPKVLPSCAIPLLQIAYTQQLEMLTTT